MLKDTPEDDLIYPTKVYIIFEQEAAKKLARELKEFRLPDDSKAYFKSTCEPSNIQWQNHDSTEKSRAAGFTGSIIMVGLFLTASFLMAYYEDSIEDILLKKYYNPLDC